MSSLNSQNVLASDQLLNQVYNDFSSSSQPPAIQYTQVESNSTMPLRSFWNFCWSAVTEVSYILVTAKIIKECTTVVFKHQPDTYNKNFGAMVFAPIVEEIIYRGVLQGIIIKNIQHYSYKWWRKREATPEELQSQKTFRVWSSALIFGAVHARNEHSNYYSKAIQVILAAGGGVLYGNLKESTGSIAPGMVFHAFNNFITAYTNNVLVVLGVYISNKITSHQVNKLFEKYNARFNNNNSETQASRFSWIKSAITGTAFVSMAAFSAHVIATVRFLKQNVSMEDVYDKVVFGPLIFELAHSTCLSGVRGIQYYSFKWIRGRAPTESEIKAQRLFRIFGLAAVVGGITAAVSNANTIQKRMCHAFIGAAWGAASGTLKEITGSTAPSVFTASLLCIKFA